MYDDGNEKEKKSTRTGRQDDHSPRILQLLVLLSMNL